MLLLPPRRAVHQRTITKQGSSDNLLVLLDRRAARRFSGLLWLVVSLPRRGPAHCLHQLGASAYERSDRRSPALSQVSRRESEAVRASRSFRPIDTTRKARTSIEPSRDGRLESFHLWPQHGEPRFVPI